MHPSPNARRQSCVAGLVAGLLALFTPTLILASNPASAAPADGQPKISGLLLDAQGLPLAAGRVELFPLTDSYETSLSFLRDGLPEPLVHGSSDAAGRFLLVAPAAGIYRLVARSAGYVAMQQRPLILLADTELAPTVLLPDTGLGVRLTTAVGQPAAGTWTVATTPSDGRSDSKWVAEHWAPQSVRGWRPHPRFARADAAGRVRLPRADGEPLGLHVLNLNVLNLPVGKTLAGGPGNEDRELSLPRAEPRAITVASTGGQPLVDVLLMPGTRPWPVGITGADGQLVIDATVGQSLPLLALSADGRRVQTRLGAVPDAVVELPDLQQLTGRVVDAATGLPIIDAWIWTVSDPGRFVRSDTDGRFQVDLPPSSQTVQVEAPGFVPDAFEFEADSAQAPILVSLERAVGVMGWVSTPEGQPVADVHFEARAESNHQRGFIQADRVDQRAVSRREGRFEMARLEAGVTYYLRASKPGFASEVMKFTAPRSQRARSRLDIVLRPRIDVYGQVVDLADQPLAGATIELRAAGAPANVGQPGAVGPRAESGADGRFEIRGLPAGMVDLVAKRQGFAPSVVRGLEVSAAYQATGHQATGHRVDLGIVTLEPGVQVSGRVIDTAGNVVVGGQVYVLPLDAPTPDDETLADSQANAVSGSQGEFTVGDLLPGERVDLRVFGPAHLPGWARGVKVANAEANTETDQATREVAVEVVLERAFQLSGSVVDEEGEGIVGASVGLVSQDILPGSGGRLRAGRTVTGHAMTGDGGRFELTTVPAGNALLQVEAEGFVPIEGHPLTLAAAHRDGLELVLERGATLEGFVTAGDEPVAQTRISSGAVTTVADIEGFYRLTGVKPGTTEVDAVHPDYPPQNETVEIGREVASLDFEFAVGQPVSGQVVDEDQWPVAGAEIRFSAHRQGQPLDYRGTTAADGSFQFTTVATGQYQVGVRREGFALAESALTVGSAAVDDVTLVLSRGSTVYGQIHGLDFDELSRVKVGATGSGGRGVAGSVDYAGSFQLTGLAAGDWLIQAQVGGGERQARRRLAVTADSGDQRIDLEFGGELTVTGRVIFAGAPLAETRVSLTGLDVDYQRAVATDHAGDFRLDDLRRGSYRLGLSNAAELLVHNENLRLESDRHLDLDLGAADVSGQVNAAGSPLAGALVVLERRVDSEQATEFIVTGDTDSSGAFHLPRVPSGAFRLTVRRDGYAQAELELEVPASGEVSGLQVELEPTHGLTLQVRLASGALPSGVHLHVVAAGGSSFLSESRAPDATGQVRFPTVPPGSWQLEVGAPGAASVSAEVTVPGDAVSLVLPLAGQLEVQVPALATTDVAATVQLLDGFGRPFEVVELGGRPQSVWTLVGGKAMIDGVPAASWTVQVIDPTGRSWQGAVTTPGRGVAGVVLE